MSYVKVKNLSVVKDTDGSYFVKVTCADSNVTDYKGNCVYYKTEWEKGKGRTKESLELELLQDFFYGELQGGSSKFNEYIQARGNFFSGKGKVSKKYQSYDVLKNRIYQNIESIQENPLEWELYGKIGQRAKREVERIIYQDFLDFCKEQSEKKKQQIKVILLVTEPNEYNKDVTMNKGYIRMEKGQRNPRITGLEEWATVYTDIKACEKMENKLANMGYGAVRIEVV